MPLQVLGHIGYHILAAGLNGYMATITNLRNPVNKWRCGAAPLTVRISFSIMRFFFFYNFHIMVPWGVLLIWGIDSSDWI